jgi:hypothetical protein
MTTKRDGIYVYVTWIPKLLTAAGCPFQLWFQANYQGFTKQPRDRDLSKWEIEHGAMLTERVQTLQSAGYTCTTEDQNSFRIKNADKTITISGKTDIIATGPGIVRVEDCKTGQEKSEHVWQVQLYMLLLPHAIPELKGKTLHGAVVYKSRTVEIPPEAVDQQFIAAVRRVLDYTKAMPAAVPSRTTCRFCDITVEDCPDRIEPGPAPTADFL